MHKHNQLVNLSQIDQISSGDPNFKTEMIGIFTNQIPVFIKNINAFWDKKDLENLAREVHTAKSSVLIFGMEDTGKYLKEIQLLAESKDTQQLPDLIEKVLNDFNEALRYLNDLK